jgi:Predicted phosphohydrolases
MIYFYRSIVPQLLLNAFIVYRIWKSKDIPHFLKCVLSFLYGAEAVMYFIGLLFPSYLSIETYTLIQEISGVWVLFNAYLAVQILGFDLFWYANRRWNLSPPFKPRTRKRIKIIGFLGVLCFIGILLLWGYHRFLHPGLRTFTFSFNKPEVPGIRPKATYKLLVAADLHLGYVINKDVLEAYVDLINDQHADIVVINGDLVDYTMRPLIETGMDEELRKLKAPYGIYFVPGNHEYKFDPEERFEWIRNAGITVLKDSSVTINSTLTLIGRDDRSQKDKRKPLADLLKKTDTSYPYILFTHQPGDLKEIYRYRIPLTICGHTHGGQVFPGNVASYIMYTNPYGWQRRGESASYTTSGLGLSGLPLRVGTRSEIVVFYIEIY